MGTIRITKNLASYCANSLMLGLGDLNTNFMIIYFGTRPTSPEVVSTGATFASSELLWWPIVAESRSIVDNDFTWTFDYKLADAGGDASWFAVRGMDNISTTGHNNPNSITDIITGSIGIPGSGADLIISNVSVVAGQPYNVGPFTIRMPQTFTF